MSSEGTNPTINLLITDLDNTLYDWVGFYIHSFNCMVSEMAELLGMAEEGLLEEFQEVHRLRGDSEYPFGLLELRTVLAKYHHLSRSEIRGVLNSAIDRFNEARLQTLALYPGTYATLERLHEAGVAIVGYTEATATNASFRLRTLGIERFFQRLYAQVPQGEGHADLLRELAWPEPVVPVVHLGWDCRKPNAEVLLRICRDQAVEPGRAALRRRQLGVRRRDGEGGGPLVGLGGVRDPVRPGVLGPRREDHALDLRRLRAGAGR